MKLQTELITLWLSCGFCRLGYVVAWPGTRYGGGGVEIRKVGCTWDKQDISPRTRKIPYLISSSYSVNILYIYIRIKKKIVKVFKDQGLRVTIQTNLKTVDFLDVTFNLPNDTFSPYRKPNDAPCYVNKLSNHPPTILQNIPDAINRRVASISSSEQVYDQAIPTYKEALKNSGYSTPISYPDKNLTSRKRQRKRKVISFHPPFSKSVATNVAKRFICLVDKHFKKPSKLSKIFNRNTLKVSYSCMPNVASIITSHNKKILGNTTPDAICNCRVKSQCPMDGKCQERSIIYKAVVTSAETKKQYIGLTEHAFKQRYSNHQTSFRHQKYEQSTELSKHIWMLKKGNEPYSIAWEIVRKPHRTQTKQRSVNCAWLRSYTS